MGCPTLYFMVQARPYRVRPGPGYWARSKLAGLIRDLLIYLILSHALERCMKCLPIFHKISHPAWVFERPVHLEDCALPSCSAPNRVTTCAKNQSKEEKRRKLKLKSREGEVRERRRRRIQSEESVAEVRWSPGIPP